MPLPDFFVIGACRSGTTALFHALIQHPDVFMPAVKEPHFFLSPEERSGLDAAARPGLRRRGFSGPVTDPHHYLALFEGGSGHQALGEASTGYLASPWAARRIRGSIPEAKLVAVLRNPVDRAHAHYWFDVMWDFAPAPSFEQSLSREQARGAPCGPLGHFDHGLYHRHLSVYYELFPPAQIRVYLYEQWRDSPRDLLRDLFTFLGVDSSFEPGLRNCNVTRAPRSRRLRRLAVNSSLPGLDRLDRRHNLVRPPPMRPETRAALLECYAPDIERLQTLIGRDLSHWLTESAPEVDRAAA